jgi:hypothetical protein
MPAPALRSPRQPSQLERVAGIHGDLERIAAETVDLTAADDLRDVLALVDRFGASLLQPNPAVVKAWLVAWGLAGGWWRRWTATAIINLLGVRHG